MCRRGWRRRCAGRASSSPTFRGRSGTSRPLLESQPVIDAWARWLELADEPDPDALAAGLEERIGPLADARRGTQGGRRRGAAEARGRVAAGARRPWPPGSPARAEAYERRETIEALKKAETWLKNAAVEIRNDRFAPIADEAMEIWELLRQRSNVELGRIELEGTGVRRRVTLDVTVDGVAGRGARRHEPGRAPRARAQPVLPARDAAREPVPLRRRRRPGPVDGSGQGRRARSRARARRRDAPGDRLHARRPSLRGGAPARDRGDDLRGRAQGGLGRRDSRPRSTPSSATSRTRARSREPTSSPRRSSGASSRASADSRSRRPASRPCAGAASVAASAHRTVEELLAPEPS